MVTEKKVEKKVFIEKFQKEYSDIRAYNNIIRKRLNVEKESQEQETKRDRIERRIFFERYFGLVCNILCFLSKILLWYLCIFSMHVSSCCLSVMMQSILANVYLNFNGTTFDCFGIIELLTFGYQSNL